MQALLKRLPALVLAASVAWTAGCGIETKVVGVVAETDITTAETALLLARGQNSELGDIFAACQYAEEMAKPTDELYIGSTSSYDARISASDFHDRPQSSCYGQATEASWSGLYAVQKIAEVDGKIDVDPDADPLIARMWLNSGLGERQLGEMFCEANFNYGPEGGILLKGPKPYDPSEIVSNDSIFRRVLYFADQAIPIAQAALAANAPATDGWYLFDPQVILTSSYGLKAQAYLILEEWDLADEFAAKALAEPIGMLPPTEGNLYPGGAGIDFIEYTHMSELTGETNDIEYAFHRDDEGGLWNTPAVNQFEGDPRIPLVHCGEFKPGVVPGGSKSSSDFILYTNRPGCKLEYTRDEYAVENNMYPRYVELKYAARESDMELVTGTEMVLIRAEAALQRGDLAAFTTFINQERAHYGLDPIEQPATAGALEYPNAEDDAWSILDRERYLELWLEGRRFKDLWRWNHPFWTDPEGHYITIEHASIGGDGPRAWTCYPMPSNECETNPLIRTTETCKTLYPPGTG